MSNNAVETRQHTAKSRNIVGGETFDLENSNATYIFGEPPPTPRPQSSRQRPKSGYKVRRTPIIAAEQHYSDTTDPHGYNSSAQHPDYIHYERQQQHGEPQLDHHNDFGRPPSARRKVDRPVSARWQQERFQSPRGSIDSGVFPNNSESYQDTYRPQSSSRPTSARAKAKYNRRERLMADSSDDRSVTTTPVSRPGSASSFSRYNVLPDIGSKSNTPEPAFHMKSQIAKQQKPENLSSSPPEQSTWSRDVVSPRSEKMAIGSLLLRETFGREHSFVGQRYQDIHKSLDQKMKELNLDSEGLNGNNELQNVESPHRDESKSAIIHIPTDKNNSEDSGIDVSNDTDHACLKLDTMELLYPPLKRKVVVPPEPDEKQPRILLAIKLPNGQRIKRHFRLADTLLQVLRFAEFSSQLDFTGCEIVCDAPRKVFDDPDIKMSDTGLENRTVLHLQKPDE